MDSASLDFAFWPEVLFFIALTIDFAFSTLEIEHSDFASHFLDNHALQMHFLSNFYPQYPIKQV